MDSQTEREIIESVDEEPWMQGKKPSLPESPASVNLRAYIDGYAVQFTIRATDMGPLIAQIESLIKTGKSVGWKPSWKDEPAKPMQQIAAPSQPREVVEEGNIMCPMHNEKMYKKTGQYGTYFSHGWQQNGYWMNCNGKSTKQGKPVS